MLNKILVCFDGSVESHNAVKVSEFLARKFKSSVHAVYVIPNFKGFMGAISVEEQNKFGDWIDKNLINKQTDGLEKIKKSLSEARIKFSYELVSGLPYEEIIKRIKKGQFSMVALGKGRFNKNNILGGTALKLLKNSPIPLLVVGNTITSGSIKNILLPMDTFKDVKGDDIEYARALSDKFRSKIYLFNVVETGDHNFPAEVVESMKGNSYDLLAKFIHKQDLGKKFEPVVRVAKNAWMGINDYVKDNDVDMMLINTYGGKKIRTEYIGSIAEKVIQYSDCPVIAIPGRM